jgi:hypothetical protein
MACRKDLRSSIYLIYVPMFKDNHGVTSIGANLSG